MINSTVDIPLNFCGSAWAAIYKHVLLAFRADLSRWGKDGRNLVLTCCNDGSRPVIFKVERIED